MFSIKKIFYILFFIFLFQIPIFSLTLEGEVEFDWINLKQADRDNQIAKIQSEIFNDDLVKKYDKNEFKKQYNAFLKDQNFKQVRYDILSNKEDFGDKIINSFFYKKILYAYGVINKSDLFHCYYYDALGRVFIIEIFEKPYNDYPVVSKQYDKNGKLQAVIYNKNFMDEFVYDAKGNFIGRWYIDKYYNQNGKVIMNRTLHF